MPQVFAEIVKGQLIICLQCLVQTAQLKGFVGVFPLSHQNSQVLLHISISACVRFPQSGIKPLKRIGMLSCLPPGCLPSKDGISGTASEYLPYANVLGIMLILKHAR